METPLLADVGRSGGVPFHYWSVVFFLFGSMVGSFVNVCIHRLPREESIVLPGSHCPRCNHAIPWHMNIPLVSWLRLRGRCAFCRAPISARYFLVELLMAVAFLACWLSFGERSATLALAYCLVIAGLVVATFIDLEHFIIPDSITLGGMAAGFACSFLVPALHGTDSNVAALRRCLGGMILGAAIIYVFLRLGKLAFGRQKCPVPPGSTVFFTESTLVLPDQEIPYEELFYRASDAVTLRAQRLEMPDRGYREVEVRLTRQELRVGNETFDPEQVPCMEVVTDRVVLPREAMGLGDVKFMAAIGAFLGWKGVLFSLLLSAGVGSAVGLVLIALRRKAWSSQIPYGPYIAVAAVVWLFGGERLMRWWFGLWSF